MGLLAFLFYCLLEHAVHNSVPHHQGIRYVAAAEHHLLACGFSRTENMMCIVWFVAQACLRCWLGEAALEIHDENSPAIPLAPETIEAGQSCRGMSAMRERSVSIIVRAAGTNKIFKITVNITRTESAALITVRLQNSLTVHIGVHPCINQSQLYQFQQPYVIYYHFIKPAVTQ